MAMVLLYPKRGGTGGINRAEPQYWPQSLVPKMLKNGWSNVPDVEDPKVASSLIEKAQAETQAELAKIAAEREELIKMKAEIDALKAQFGEKKPGRPKSVEV